MEEERRQQHLYMQCMKNQSANLGSYTVDGCGEFVSENNEVNCSACGCHRSFHLKVPAIQGRIQATAATRYISQQLLLPLENQEMEKQRRARTKFTVEQKEQMERFAQKIGWRLAKCGREEEVERFLEESGVSRRAFRVWMHNHRNTAAHAKAAAAADSSDTEHTDDSALAAITAGINDNFEV